MIPHFSTFFFFAHSAGFCKLVTSTVRYEITDECWWYSTVELILFYLRMPRSKDTPHSTVLSVHHLSDLTLMSSASAAQATCSHG